MSTLLLRGARLLGVDRPQDVLIDGGRIAAIGTGAVPADEVVELDGRHLLPGLWDAHVHLGQWAMVSRRLDLSPAASAAETAALVLARIAQAPLPAGEALVGYGFRDALWPDAPTAALLATETPVVLVSGDVHCVWVNRAAQRMLSLPEGDGVLREQAAFDLNTRVSAVEEATLDRWVLDAAAAAATRGVVGVRDLEMLGAVESWRRRVVTGFRGLRVQAAVYPPELDAAAAAGIRTGEAIDGTAGLVVGGHVKLFADGSLNTRTAWCYDPYPDGSTGEPSHEPERLLELARAALRHGIVPTIHAIGDRAVTLALDTFERLGPLPAPGTIEHAQLVRDEDLPRFAALGVAASVQPEHAMDDRDVADRYWAGRTGRSFAYASLARAGARLMLGSDAPVSPLDPWVAIAAAVGRTREGREPWHPEQALSVTAALAASARSSVAVGEPADLVIVERDPLASTPDQLRTMPVAATLLGGRFTHR